MKSQRSRQSTERLPRGHRIALSTFVLSFVLMVLVAAFVLYRPILMAQVQVERPDLDRADTESVATGPAVPTETASGIGSRMSGDLDALPASAYARGQTITVGVSDAHGQINPLYGGGDGDHDAIDLIFEPLLRIDAAGQPELVLAESITPDLSKRTITVQLRADHIWRDGRAVDAADVAFTYNCLLSPSYDGPLAGRFDDIATVEAVPAKPAGKGGADDASGSGRQTVVFTFKPGVAAFDNSLLAIGILKRDHYAVPADKVYEMGRKKLPPEGSGPYQWLETNGSRRVLGLREGYAGDILRIEQLVVGSDEKYPMLQAGALDIVRHDWSERIQSRVARLPAYAYFDAFRIDQYLLTAPNPARNGLPDDPNAIANILRIATGQTGTAQGQHDPAAAAQPLTLAYFDGIEETVSRQQAANAELIRRRLEQAGQPVTLQPLSWPELADRASLGTYQLLLLPAATDNRLPRAAVIKETSGRQPVNAAIAFQHPEILLVSARLEGLKVNPNGAPFTASPLTYTGKIASVRILGADGSPVTG